MLERLGLALVAILATVLAVFAGVALRPAAPAGGPDVLAYPVPTPSTSASARASTDPSTVPSTDPSTASDQTEAKDVLVIGDSAAAGVLASTPERSWVRLVAARLQWRVTDLSVRGAGYEGRSYGTGSCRLSPCPRFTQLLEAIDPRSVHPDLVLVAGGRDDIPQAGAAMDAARQAFFTRLRALFPEARVLALNVDYDEPFVTSVPAEPLQAAVRRIDGTVVDIGQPLLRHPERLGNDGLRPNDAGHAAIARKVVSAVQTLTE